MSHDGSSQTSVTRLVWLMCLPLVVATVAFLAIGRQPKRHEQLIATATPPPLVAPITEPKPKGAAPTAVVARPHKAEPPTKPPPETRVPEELPPFEALTKKWESQLPDAAWNRNLRKDIADVLSSNGLRDDILREADCRQTLCRIVVEDNILATLPIRTKLQEAHLSISYVQEYPSDEIVAIIDRSPEAFAKTVP